MTAAPLGPCPHRRWLHVGPADTSFDVPRFVCRDVLPLPMPEASVAPRWRGLPVSRTVVRRLQRAKHRDERLQLGVAALNSLGDDGTNNFDTGCAQASDAQMESLRRLEALYSKVPAPENQQSAREAWKELQSALPGYFSSEVGALAAFQEGHVALPPLGSHPAPLTEELRPEDRLFLDNPSRVLLDDQRVRGKLLLCGIEEPYVDPVLRHNRKKYSRFVSDLCRRGVVSFGSRCKAKVGAFFPN